MIKFSKAEGLYILGHGILIALLLLGIMGVVRLGGELHHPSQIVLLDDVSETNVACLDIYTASNANLSGLIVEYEEISQSGYDVNAAATNNLLLQILNTSGSPQTSAAYDVIHDGISLSPGTPDWGEGNETDGWRLIENLVSWPINNDSAGRLAGQVTISNLDNGPKMYGDQIFRTNMNVVGGSVYGSYDTTVSGGAGGVRFHFTNSDYVQGRVRLYGIMPE